MRVAPMNWSFTAERLGWGSDEPGIAASVEVDVHAAHVAGVRRADERAGGAELLGPAHAPGRDGLRDPLPRLLHGDAVALHVALGHVALAVGVEALGQQVVQGHVVAGDVARDALADGRQPGTRTGGDAQVTARRG